MVGVTADQMQQKETMDFIYDFVESRGGIENFTREIDMEQIDNPGLPSLKDAGKDYINAVKFD